MQGDRESDLLTMNRKGLTLIEVTIAVAIIAILATVAVPSYQRTLERRYWQSAQDVLQTIYTGEAVYKSANNGYLALPAGSASTEWNKIYMDNPNTGSSIPVTFLVNVNNTATPPTFTATATRSGDNRCMTIDQTKTVNLSPGGCPAWTKP